MDKVYHNYTAEPLYCRHPWDSLKCSIIKGMSSFQGWFCTQLMYVAGTIHVHSILIKRDVLIERFYSTSTVKVHTVACGSMAFFDVVEE